MTRWPSVRHRVEVREHRVARARRAGAGTGSGRGAARRRARVVVGAELGAEVDAFLAVGYPRRELAADREPAPPRAAAVRHRDLGLLGFVECEELASQRVEAASQRGIDAVADDREEAGVTARGVDRGRDGIVGRRGPVTSGRDVDSRHEHRACLLQERRRGIPR